MVLLCFLKYKEVYIAVKAKQLWPRDNEEVGYNDHTYCNVVKVILSKTITVIK